MKVPNITVLTSAILALLGVLMPVASKGNLVVSVHDMAGAVYLLYAIPIYLLIASILALTGKITTLKAWFLPATILGLLLASAAVFSGVEYAKSFSDVVGMFGKQSLMQGLTAGEVTVGVGGVLMLAAYSIATLLSFFAKSNKQSSSEGAA